MSLITTRDTRYPAFHKVVDSITDELQDMIWLGESKPRRRLKGEHLNKLKYSVEKLVRDSVASQGHSSVGGASATPTPRGIVYRPDLRLAVRNCKPS